MTSLGIEPDDRVTREIIGILIDPDAPGTLIRVENDHASICTTLNASNTEAYFFRNSPAIAWMSAEGGEWNLPARGFLQAVDLQSAIGSVSGPVLIVGESEDGEVCDVPNKLVAAASGYGILSRD